MGIKSLRRTSSKVRLATKGFVALNRSSKPMSSIVSNESIAVAPQ